MKQTFGIAAFAAVAFTAMLVGVEGHASAHAVGGVWRRPAPFAVRAIERDSELAFQRELDPCRAS
jgi:hypothetical protein